MSLDDDVSVGLVSKDDCPTILPTKMLLPKNRSLRRGDRATSFPSTKIVLFLGALSFLDRLESARFKNPTFDRLRSKVLERSTSNQSGIGCLMRMVISAGGTKV